MTVVAVELAVATVDDHPLDPEDELALAAPVRQAARSRIVERGGVILGDIGGGLSACFGYPSTERSIERAVLAALAVRDLAAGADGRIAIRIGIDTGVVVVEGRSQDGTDELSTIAGEPLRAATRLRSAGRRRRGARRRGHGGRRARPRRVGTPRPGGRTVSGARHRIAGGRARRSPGAARRLGRS